MARKRGSWSFVLKPVLWVMSLLLLGAFAGVLILAGCKNKGKENVSPAVDPQKNRKDTHTKGSQPKLTTPRTTTELPDAIASVAPLSKQLNGIKSQEPPKLLIPRIALVIDDLGQAEPALVQRLCSLGISLTVAVLPFMPHSQESARIAKSKGMEVILHMPMEPVGYPELGKDPGPGAVLFNQKEAEVRKKLTLAMREIPYAVGFNNHMGSRITPDRLRMNWMLEEAKKGGWFFLDSRTDKETVAMEVATELGIPALERNVFLDDSHDPAEMMHQWERAITLARQDKQVVIIGHILEETVTFLEKAVPRFTDEVKFVKASELAK